MNSLSAAVQRVRALESELEHTREEQARLKNDFLSLVSHGLRTPLNNLCLSISNLADGLLGEVSPRQREVLGIALSNAGHLQRMIGALLDAARADANDLPVTLEPVRLNDVLRATAQPFEVDAVRSGVALQLELAENLPPVRTDAARLRQVVSYLLENAVGSTPAGGRITLRSEAASGAAELRVGVIDTGCGISRAGMDHIFERFFQDRIVTDADHSVGLGLSLYISNQLVQRLGGRIWAESEPGIGSSFFLTLPVAFDGANDRHQCDTGGVRA